MRNFLGGEERISGEEQEINYIMDHVVYEATEENGQQKRRRRVLRGRQEFITTCATLSLLLFRIFERDV